MKDANSLSRFELRQEGSRWRPLFLGLLTGPGWQAAEGCVLFCSSFPKINAVRAGDNHRAAVVARWPRGPPLASPARPKFTPRRAKTGGRRARKQPAPTCLHPARTGPNDGGLNPRRWRRWKKGVDFFLFFSLSLNLHAAGCTRPIYLGNNRGRDVRDLARGAPLSRALAAGKYTAALKGDNHLVGDKRSRRLANLPPGHDITQGHMHVPARVHEY